MSSQETSKKQANQDLRGVGNLESLLSMKSQINYCKKGREQSIYYHILKM